jgi:hypothetical protein
MGIDILRLEMKIELQPYWYTCGDGCCDEYGYNVLVDGKIIGSIGEDSQELAELLNETFKQEEQ